MLFILCTLSLVSATSTADNPNDLSAPLQSNLEKDLEDANRGIIRLTAYSEDEMHKHFIELQLALQASKANEEESCQHILTGPFWEALSHVVKGVFTDGSSLAWKVHQIEDKREKIKILMENIANFVKRDPVFNSFLMIMGFVLFMEKTTISTFVTANIADVMHAVPAWGRFLGYVPVAYTAMRLYGGASVPCLCAAISTIIAMIEAQDPNRINFQGELMNMFGPALAALFPWMIGPQKTLYITTLLQRSPMFAATMNVAMKLNKSTDERSRILKSILGHMIPQSGSSMTAIQPLLLDKVPTLMVYAMLGAIEDVVVSDTILGLSHPEMVVNTLIGSSVVGQAIAIIDAASPWTGDGCQYREMVQRFFALAIWLDFAIPKWNAEEGDITFSELVLVWLAPHILNPAVNGGMEIFTVLCGMLQRKVR